jgi:EpsI family protein
LKAWPFAAAALLIGTTLAFTEVRAQKPETAPATPLVGLPESMGRWIMVRDLPLSDKDLDLLKLSDYVSRAYASETPGEGPVLLYVGYYRSQRTGSTYHSPLNCLPGSGWQIAESGYVAVPGRGFEVKRLVIEKELRRDVVLYGYVDRGRVITSEYAAKAYLVWDGLKWNRTDGALMRISAPVTSTPEEATARALAFLTDFWPFLQERLPAPSRS